MRGASPNLPEEIIDTLRKSVCRIEISNTKIFTGFFMKINLNNKLTNFLLTCNHCIKQEDIDSNLIISVYYGKNQKEKKVTIKLDKNNRIINTYIEFDVTLIEILSEDNIKSKMFLYPDLNYKNEKNFSQYLNTQVYLAGFPNVPIHKGQRHMSSGLIKKIDENEKNFEHSCDTRNGSSGSPIINNNSLVIGIHYGGDKNNTTNYGYFIGAILDKLNLEKKENDICLKEENIKPIKSLDMHLEKVNNNPTKSLDKHLEEIYKPTKILYMKEEGENNNPKKILNMHEEGENNNPTKALNVPREGEINKPAITLNMKEEGENNNPKKALIMHGEGENNNPSITLNMHREGKNKNPIKTLNMLGEGENNNPTKTLNINVRKKNDYPIKSPNENNEFLKNKNKKIPNKEENIFDSIGPFFINAIKSIYNNPEVIDIMNNSPIFNENPNIVRAVRNPELLFNMARKGDLDGVTNLLKKNPNENSVKDNNEINLNSENLNKICEELIEDEK